MSKFLSYYNLFPIPDPNEFLGMAADKENGNVITTLARNVVVVLNINTHKQINSWSMPEKLSTKVVYDPLNQKYVGCFGNHALRLWSVDTTDVSKCKKFKFQKSIAHVLSTDPESIVLYSDGSCQTLTEALQSRKEQKENTAEQLALAASKTLSNPTEHCLPDGQQMISYFEVCNKSGELSFVQCWLSTMARRSFVIKRESVTLAGYAVIESDSGPQLMTIWDDKRIFMFNLTAKSLDGAPGQFVSMLAELNVGTKLSLYGLSRNFVAIYGANYGQEGASLLVYNTQFKVVNAKIYFKVFLDFSRLWACDEHILLAMGQNIASVHYGMSAELLVDMIGSQTSESHCNPIELDHINEEESLESAIKFGGSAQTNHPIDETKELKKKYIRITPSDGMKKAYDSPEIFKQDAHQFLKPHIDGSILVVDNKVEDVNVTLMRNFFDEGPQSLAVQNLVRQLERSGAGEQEITDKLLTMLVKTESTEEVLMCVRRYSNISEQTLTLCLRYALDKTPKNLTNGEISGKSASDELLNAVLACSFDPVDIVGHLKQRLDLAQVRRLIEHLYVLATDPDALLEERPNQQISTYDSMFTELQVGQWLSALTASHVTQMIISKDEELLQILKNWSEYFQNYADVLPKISNLSAIVSSLRRDRPTVKYHNKWYGIEKIKFY